MPDVRLTPIEKAISDALTAKLDDRDMDSRDFFRNLLSMGVPSSLRDAMVTLQEYNPQVALPFLLALQDVDAKKIREAWPRFIAWMCSTGYVPVGSGAAHAILWRLSLGRFMAWPPQRVVPDEDIKRAEKLRREYAEVLAQKLIEIMKSGDCEDGADLDPP